MIVGSQAEAMQLENVTANPSTQAEGLIYQNTTNHKPVIDDGTDVSEFLLEKHLSSVLDTQNLKGKVAATDTYANLVSRPRVAGLTYLASDLDTIFFDNGTELKEVSGGKGSAFTYHVEDFETTTSANISVSGNATVGDETAEPLTGTRSVVITQQTGSLNDTILIDKIIPIQKGQRGIRNTLSALVASNNDLAGKFRFKIAESSDDIAYADIEDSFVEFNPQTNPQVFSFNYTPDVASTSLKIKVEVSEESTGKQLILDSIELSNRGEKVIAFDNNTPVESFTPVWVGVTNVGDTVNSGKFQYQGDRLIGTASLTLGATASISGPLALTMPDGVEIGSAKLAFGAGAEQKLGDVIFDNIDDVPYLGFATRASATEIELKHIVNNDGVNRSVYLGRTSSTSPFTWDTNDTITVLFDVPVKGRSAQGSGVVSNGQSTPYETKYLSSDITTTGIISEFTFSGLTIGNDYDLNLALNTYRTSTSSNTKQVQVQINGIDQPWNGLERDGDSTDIYPILTFSKRVKATASEITVEVTGLVNLLIQSGLSKSFFQVIPVNNPTVISPFKTEITDGVEYKTGEVIGGKDVYAKRFYSLGGQTSTFIIGNLGTISDFIGFEGSIRTAILGWSTLSFTSPSSSTNFYRTQLDGGNNVEIAISGFTVEEASITAKYTK